MSKPNLGLPEELESLALKQLAGEEPEHDHDFDFREECDRQARESFEAEQKLFDQQQEK